MTKERQRHPSTQIQVDTIEEVAYRLYLERLEPPLTPEQSVATTRIDGVGKVVASDATRRTNSKGYLPLVRDLLKVLVDMGMIMP